MSDVKYEEHDIIRRLLDDMIRRHHHAFKGKDPRMIALMPRYYALWREYRIYRDKYHKMGPLDMYLGIPIKCHEHLTPIGTVVRTIQ